MLGIFVELPKTFDNVNHQIVLKNLNVMVELERIILPLKTTLLLSENYVL